MFKHISKSLESLFPRQKSSIDPTQFNDPVAVNTCWESFKPGGVNFRTHKLVQLTPDRLVFRFSTVFAIVCFAVAALGAYTILASLSEYLKNPSEIIGPIFMLLIGTGFFGAALFLFLNNGTPAVFDRTKNCFWRGWKKLEPHLNIVHTKNWCELSEIHALQIVSEHCRGNRSSFYSYELNLVLSDASRHNVVDHRDINLLRQNAEVVSRFLDIPIWDASGK